MLALHGMPIKGLADKMTDEEFYEFCMANDHLQMERDAHGNIFIMSPVGSESGRLENEINFWLTAWNKKIGKGYTFSSSAGFNLPDGSTRAPDAAWVSAERWDALSEEEQKRFAPLAPEFIIELRSESDDLAQLQEKMTEVWMKNGVQLAWLIDPVERKAYIYRADGSQEVAQGFERELPGEDVLPGFRFDLRHLS